MCGITGFFSSTSAFSLHDLQVMTQKVSHRGPDAEGFYSDEVCGLGHRRLSILDLSEKANQPMYTHNGRYVIVFNGEIYNFKDIAHSLGLILHTTSDTEVILEAFNKLGIECVHLFNGMFAFAIYDTIEQELYLVRDRLGIKPLFYFWDGINLAFASELKSLVELVQIPKEVNMQAVKQFLHIGYIAAPQTIYCNIFKMLPGSYCKISKKGLQSTHYWQLSKQISSAVITGENDARQIVRDLLKSAVNYQLISDVPVGIFLSGGIDSSTLAALAVEQSNARVNTFSIGLQENKYNEAVYARDVARHLQTNHHEMIVSAKEAKELVDVMFTTYDEPFADSSAIPTMLVSKLAQPHVKVVLSGDGGDELFFGYGMYQWADRLANPLVNLSKKALSNLLKTSRQVRFQKAAYMLDYEEDQHLASHVFSQEQGFFTQKEIKQLFKNKGNAIKYYPSVNTFRPLEAMEEQALFDLQYYLPDDLLVKVDRATMRHSLEARVPLLDHRIVEFALNLTPDLKYKNGIRKYLLKEILFQYLPKQLFDRPKRGFSIPLQEWLRKDLKYLIDDYLNEKIITTYSLVTYAEVKKIKEQFLAGNNYFYHRIWLLIVLHRWFAKHI